MQHRQSRRKAITANGVCHFDRGVDLPVEIADLSRGGCQVTGVADIPVHGQRIGLSIAQTGPYRARVAWKRGERVGLTFIAPLSDMVLAALIDGDWESAGAMTAHLGGQSAVRRPV